MGLVKLFILESAPELHLPELWLAGTAAGALCGQQAPGDRRQDRW